MDLRKLLTLAASIAILPAAFLTSARADTFSSVVVYGDSLSDNGNLYAAYGYPPYPYYMGRFSNGPVAVEQLATNLGLPLYDFAVGGATTGVGNYIDNGTQTTAGFAGLPGIAAEVASPASTALLASPLVSSSLFVVWGGANDFLTAGSPSTAASDIEAIVATLQGDGATHILVPGIPNLGLTPEFYGSNVATAYSIAFNTALQAALPRGATYVDTFNLLTNIEANPSAYGFNNNVATPCFTGYTAFSLCSNTAGYLFFDDFHPTTAADSIVAASFQAAATGVTPEPSSLLLLGTGAMALSAFVRRKRVPHESLPKQHSTGGQQQVF